jgi:hypothetical protein
MRIDHLVGEVEKSGKGPLDKAIIADIVQQLREPYPPPADSKVILPPINR